MTSELIGNAVAEACNWKRDHNPENDYLYRTPDGRGMLNPASDLNAMHEAEKMLNAEQQICYARALHCNHSQRHFMHEDFDLMHTTAAQRAEAFLRVLLKWEAGK